MTRPEEEALITKAPLEDDPAGDGGSAAVEEAVEAFLASLPAEVREAAWCPEATLCTVLIIETATAFS